MEFPVTSTYNQCVDPYLCSNGPNSSPYYEFRLVFSFILYHTSVTSGFCSIRGRMLIHGGGPKQDFCGEHLACRHSSSSDIMSIGQLVPHFQSCGFIPKEPHLQSLDRDLWLLGRLQPPEISGKSDSSCVDQRPTCTGELHFWKLKLLPGKTFTISLLGQDGPRLRNMC